MFGINFYAPVRILLQHYSSQKELEEMDYYSPQKLLFFHWRYAKFLSYADAEEVEEGFIYILLERGIFLRCLEINFLPVDAQEQ